MANANKTDPPEPIFQIEGATYSYYHETDEWLFTLSHAGYASYYACIPKNTVPKLRSIARYLGFDARNKKRDHLLRRIRRCKGRKQ